MRSPMTLRCLCIATLLCLSLGAGRADSTMPPPPESLQELPGVILPEEGLWSVGLGWENDWPAQWRHLQPATISIDGPWAIVRGLMETAHGNLLLQDAYRWKTEEVIEVRRRWEWTGEQTLENVTLSFRLRTTDEKLRPFLPGILYYGNPSGTKIDATRVPTFSGLPGCEAYYEEHRFPQPYAMVEQSARTVALHSRPSMVPGARREDLWWSLGLTQHDETTMELASYSGLVASNGQRGQVKALQKSFVGYPDAFLSLSPGSVVEKIYFVQSSPLEKAGHGFAAPMRVSLDLFQPWSVKEFPSFEETVEHKLRDTLKRWHEDEQCAVIRAMPEIAKPLMVMGWAGQSEAPGYALQVLAEDYPDMPLLEKVQPLMNFLSTTEFDNNGFGIRYDFEQHVWEKRRDILSQSQAIHLMVEATRVARKNQMLTTEPWEVFLRRALDDCVKRVSPQDWLPVSTNEGFLIAPFVKGARLFEEPRYLEAARKVADHYLARHLSMEEPYWGGTLDARCEDKEGAWACLQGFSALYAETNDKRYLEGAIHAGDVCLSYLYVWDVQLPAGRLNDYGFKTRGWTGVSVQNQHLDVFGVVFTPELMRLAEWTGDEQYRRLARLMFLSCGQMVHADGHQGEQFQQTNYSQFSKNNLVDADVNKMRGGYSEDWDIYWITAHFLTAAAQLKEMGVRW